MRNFILLAAGCVVLSACSQDDKQVTSTPAAPVPAYPRATPAVAPRIPNNVMMPSSSDMADQPGAEPNGSIPAAPSTVMPTQDSLYGGPPAGAENQAINYSPVPDPTAAMLQQAPDLSNNAPSQGLPSDYPIATPVSGHPGMVYTPFGTQDQWVDVSSFPPGSKVKCPYTGRMFRTPAD